MTPELLTKRCGRCKCWLASHDDGGIAPDGSSGSAWFADDDQVIGVAIFTNHHAADRAARAAGWQVLSESLGGDLCPACIEEGA